MKIIGTTSDGSYGSDSYIAVITHSEIEKVVGKYYASEKLDRLKVGSDFAISAGYDFREDIKRACTQMVEANKQFERSQATLMKFALMVAELPSEPQA